MLDEKNSDGSDAKHSFVCALFIALGIALIIAAWTPVGSLASRAMWTNEDAATYSKIRLQSHGSAYKTAARSGLSEAQMQAQSERMEVQAEAMQAKLKRAREQPQRWSRYLLGVGTLLAAVGFFAHSARHS